MGRMNVKSERGIFLTGISKDSVNEGE